MVNGLRALVRGPMAMLFLMLSIAVHVGVLQMGRTRAAKEAARQEPAREPAIVAVRILAAPAPPAAPEPVASAPAKPPVPARAPKVRGASGPSAATAPSHRAPLPRAARPSPAAAEPHPQATLPAPAPWVGRTLDLPEFDDSLDVAAAFAGPDIASSTPPPATPGRSSGPAANGDPAPVPARTDTPEPAVAPLAGVVLDVPIVSGSARYRVHFGDPAEGNVVAMLDQSFEIGPAHYRLYSEGRAQGVMSWFYRGTLVQESTGRVSSTGLQPSRYRERRGDRPLKESSIDPASGMAVLPSGTRSQAPPGVQDRLSVFVQLALLLRSFPSRFDPGATIELPVLASSRVETASWQVIGREPVATPDGSVAAVHLRRAPADEEDPAIDLWLALDARVLPVRVRATEPNGRALDQVIDEP